MKLALKENDAKYSESGMGMNEFSLSCKCTSIVKRVVFRIAMPLHFVLSQAPCNNGVSLK